MILIPLLFKEGLGVVAEFLIEQLFIADSFAI